ncbi:hypothetical protein HK097_003034, partial [Rhizophlyctis rosea]
MASDAMDTQQNGEEADNLMPKELLLPLIISQLQEYGMNSLAKVVADESHTPFSLEPSSRLAELAYMGSVSTGNDVSEAIAPSALLDEDERQEGIVFGEEDQRNGTLPSSESNPLRNTLTSPLNSCKIPRPTIPTLVHHRSSRSLHDSRYDGKYAATGSIDMSIKILDTTRIRSNFFGVSDEKAVMRTLYDHQAVINEVIFHPNGTIVASCSDDQTIRLYDLMKPAIKRGFRWFQ